MSLPGKDLCWKETIGAFNGLVAARDEGLSWPFVLAESLSPALVFKRFCAIGRSTERP